MLEKFNKYSMDMCCFIGWHMWYEPTMNFYNPAEIHEECSHCRKTRMRFDKRRRKDAWRKRNKWF